MYKNVGLKIKRHVKCLILDNKSINSIPPFYKYSNLQELTIVINQLELYLNNLRIIKHIIHFFK